MSDNIERNASELLRLICLYQEENTCSRQSMCYQTVLRFFMSLRETFSNSITFTVISIYGKAAVVQIKTVFLPIYHVPC